MTSYPKECPLAVCDCCYYGSVLEIQSAPVPKSDGDGDKWMDVRVRYLHPGWFGDDTDWYWHDIATMKPLTDMACKMLSLVPDGHPKAGGKT